MKRNATIDSTQRAFGADGQYVLRPQNQVILIGTRRGPFNGLPLTTADGLRVNVIQDGATINGIPFDSSLPLGERITTLNPSNRGWNVNTEFENTPSEKWGLSFFDLIANPSLAQLLASGELELNVSEVSSSYDEPFTFYYLPLKPNNIFDYNYYHLVPNWVDGVGGDGQIMSEKERDEELTGESNYDAYGL